MKCPVMYAPGEWAIIELTPEDLKRPNVKIAFRGPDDASVKRISKTFSPMPTWELRSFARFDVVLNSQIYHIFLPY